MAEHSQHPFPTMAFPATDTEQQARAYTYDLLETAHVPVPAALDWHVYGHTAHDHSPALRASWTVTVSSLSPAL